MDVGTIVSSNEPSNLVALEKVVLALEVFLKVYLAVSSTVSNMALSTA